DAYEVLHEHVGETLEENHAFLLGNQGPDPLFYLGPLPRLRQFGSLGSTMHREKPNELLAAFKKSLSILDADEYPIGRAYLFGFVCHHSLDSSLHPLVYMNQYQLCDAGIDGLDRSNGREVHALIESEFDEMVLYRKRNQTVATFSPAFEILLGSDFILKTVAKMYAYVAMTVYSRFIPNSLFVSAVRAYRFTEPFFHSRTGLKRALLGRIEEIFKPYSYIRSMSPRARETTTSSFDNHEKNTWENPFTGETTTASFWDLYELALSEVPTHVEMIDRTDFDKATAVHITENLNFSGAPTVAILTIEDAT
ncbi:MAG: hypothetical protein LBB46_00070, partial [Coriobacteriaceae bacterium]|nr:hypothetical protein [Coriobacteriaceae bacterium]